MRKFGFSNSEFISDNTFSLKNKKSDFRDFKSASNLFMH